MQPCFSQNSEIDGKIEFLIGCKENFEENMQTKTLEPFSEEILFFLNEVSKILLGDKEAKAYPDIVTYAFWIRRASTSQLKERFYVKVRNCIRLGRGNVFHIAPSNVPVNFAVSMTSALLAGNACLIRVSNKEFVQVDIICTCIKNLLNNKWKQLKPYFCIVRYEHDELVTQELTNICDIRIIWGGNETIRRIRIAALSPRAIEMAFADRYSIALIHSDSYLKMNPKEIAQKFYTDTYYSDQGACSSPRIVVWLGEQVKEAQTQFWFSLSELVHRDYELHPIQTIDKLDSFCRLAAYAQKNGIVVKRITDDNYLYRIELDKLDSGVFEYKEGGGYFYEYVASQMEEIIPILGKSCQTISCLGINKDRIMEMVKLFGVRGVDRIVDVGETMALSFRWDGYDMIETMSRWIDS